jgi:iron(III) transport system ATP-binding protein
MALIEVRDVVKKYGSFTALRGISLSVEEGEFLCLLGPSGCGKTTLMRSIAGLESIEGGRISVGERTYSEPGYMLPPERRNLGMVFQSYALWPHMTVFRNIAYTLKTNGWPKARIPERVAEVLDLVGLHGLDQRYAAQLSGGQMQRVALARSLAPEPSVLLFDEPLSNLDSKLREKMRFELRRIQQRVGITAIYVTHDQSEAMVVADRIALMKDGQIQQLGTATDLYERPSSPFAADFMGVTNFVPAEVLDGNPGDVRFAWPGGVVVAGELVGQLDGCSDVMTAVRPEHVRLHRHEPRPDDERERTVVPGTLEEVVYLGSLSEVYVRVGRSRLRSQMVPEQTEDWVEGMSVWVELERRRVRGIDRLPAGATESAEPDDETGDPTRTPIESVAVDE